MYCDSSHPHQLTGLYPLGTTCANKSGAVYTSSYDAWGNVTSRMDNGITTTLSYDGQDHLTQTSASTLSEWYAYDADGQRVLRRTSGSGGTQIITSVFGMQDSTYNGNGTKIKAVYYYSLAGRLIGRVEGGAINSFVTDELGTPLTNISAGDGSAVVNGNQRTLQGCLGTDRSFTGQYSDATRLDYDNARYYDPGAGIFLSVDTVQGNA